MITPLEFYNSTLGKSFDMDGVPKSQPFQCVDYYKKGCQEVLGFHYPTGGDGYADYYWIDKRYKDKLDYISDWTKFQNGDFVIWGNSKRFNPTPFPLSHIAMFWQENGKKYMVGENQPNKYVTKKEEPDSVWQQALGAIRFKAWNTEINPGKHRGCDVSEWNEPDTTDITPYDFLIIRAGWATTEDKFLDRWVKKAEESGKRYGFYWYSYATTPESAVEEAQKFIEVAKRYNPTVGLWMDEESDNYKSKMWNNVYDPELVTSIVVAFMRQLDTAGLYCGIYSCQSWFGTVIKTEPTKQWDKFVAAWGTNDGTIQRDTSNLGTMLQFTSHGGLDKDLTYIDLDIYDIKHTANNTNTPTEEQPGEATTTPGAEEELENLKNEVALLKTENEKLKNALTNIKALLSDLGV